MQVPEEVWDHTLVIVMLEDAIEAKLSATQLEKLELFLTHHKAQSVHLLLASHHLFPTRWGLVVDVASFLHPEKQAERSGRVDNKFVSVLCLFTDHQLAYGDPQAVVDAACYEFSSLMCAFLTGCLS